VVCVCVFFFVFCVFFFFFVFLFFFPPSTALSSFLVIIRALPPDSRDSGKPAAGGRPGLGRRPPSGEAAILLSQESPSPRNATSVRVLARAPLRGTQEKAFSLA